MDGMTRNGMGWAVVQEALEKMPMTAEAAERMAVQPRHLCTRVLLGLKWFVADTRGTQRGAGAEARVHRRLDGPSANTESPKAVVLRVLEHSVVSRVLTE